MNTRKRASRGAVLATWLSLVTLLMATFSWLPAAANESTPTANQNEAPVATLETTGEESLTIQSDPMALTGIDAICPVGASVVNGTIYVESPETGTNIAIALASSASGSPLDTDTVVSNGATSVPYSIDLSQVPVSAETDVYVSATYDGATVNSAPPFTIHQASTGVTTCGAAPAPTATATSTPITPTATSIPVTPTSTPVTPTSTPTSTPADTPSATATTPTSTATTTPANTPTATPTTPAPTASSEPTVSYATVTNTGGAGLRCRTAPVNGTIVTVVPDGTRVEVRGATESGWTPVKCGGRVDTWMSATYLRMESGTNPPPDDGAGGNTTATVVNTGGLGLRCRSGPGTDYPIITVMAEGSAVAVRGATSNGWVPLTCANRDGWASATYLRLSSDGSTPPPSDDGGLGGTGKYGVVVNTGYDNLRCRTAPVSGATITLLPPNTRVETRGAVVDGWVPVICADQKGWVSKAYFALEGESGTTTPPPTSGGGKMVTVSGTGYAGLRCRTGPSTGYTILGVIPEGGRVETRGSLANGWLPVTCFGSAGWVSAAYVLFDGQSGATGEFWIDVNLSTQFMRVYRGNTVINSTYVSTGRPGFDTPPGTFYIIRKLPSQTMSGVLGGEYYHVPNVPWVMYFTNRGHAIHGAYWHNNFGQVMSHGCVNLPVGFAEWLYYNTPMYTRVRIHY